MKRRTRLATRLQGFTLVELMVVVTLVAVLSAIAVPSFRELLLNQRLAASTSEFVAALSTARAEALKRSQTATLTPKKANDWNSGWEVRSTVEGVATTLRAFDALPGGVTVDPGLGNALDGKLSYDANGFSRKGDAYQMGCIAFRAETGRRSAVVVSASGRPKVCDPDKKGDCGTGKCNAAGD
jgi:type IV fimbrial biogenesis protein FimT